MPTAVALFPAEGCKGGELQSVRTARHCMQIGGMPKKVHRPLAGACRDLGPAGSLLGDQQPALCWRQPHKRAYQAISPQEFLAISCTFLVLHSDAQAFHRWASGREEAP